MSYVQREAVRRHPAADVHADRGDLSPRPPNAGAPGTRPAAMPNSASASIITCSMRAHVRHHVALPFSQIEDRIADDLAGPVIGDVAAAVGVMKLDAGALAAFPRCASRFSIVAVAAQGDDVRMLDDQQLIGNLAALAPLDQLAAAARTRRRSRMRPRSRRLRRQLRPCQLQALIASP